MLNTLWTLVFFVFALTILIGIHEFGHFIVARKLGIKVLRFALGFGRILAQRYDKQGTQYTIGVLPLGGYVKMLDEREGPVDPIDYPVCFNRQPLWKRTSVVLAGPVFNFLFAFAAYWVFFMIGQASVAPIIGEVNANSIAEKVGMKVQQEVIAINQQTTSNWRQVSMALLSHADENDVQVKVRTPQKTELNYRVSLRGWPLSHVDPNPLKALGVKPFLPKIPTVIAKVTPGAPAERAGIKAGDRLAALNRQTVKDWTSVVEHVKGSANKPLELSVERNGRVLTFKLTPEARTRNKVTEGFIGVQSERAQWPEHLLRHESLPITQAAVHAAKKTKQMIGFTFILIKKMVFGELSVRSLSGPVGIAQGAGATASYGFLAYLNFLALVSISLGVLNILPIPVLDGGHLLYYLIEAIRGGRPVSIKTQQIATQLGLLLILSLMGVALYNDMVRLF